MSRKIAGTRLPLASAALFLFPPFIHAQQSPDLQQILNRLDRVERENRDLAAEVSALRAELAASRTATAPSVANTTPAAAPATPQASPPLEERVDVIEQRIAEQAQTKVEASQKLPVTLTGTILFNSFLNARANNGAEYPEIAAIGSNSNPGGATFSQSLLGLKFQGPQVLGGAQLNGSVYFDLWGGTPSNSLNHLVRLRTATVELAWKNTTILVGQDKPIVSPREPSSLAQVAFPPLTYAGNLWLWSPQVRIEQRFALGPQAGFIAQVGAYQTTEPAPASRSPELGNEYSTSSTLRPAIQGRFEFWRNFANGARIEVAPGFHESTTHAAGFSLPSRLVTFDWLIQPVSKVQWSGMFFSGENAAGLGGLRQGYSIVSDERAISIGANGGWTQLSFLLTKRLTFNLFNGEEHDRQSNLLSGDIHVNQMYGANVIYRLGSNILLGAEISQVRTNYFLLPSRLNNHYDLSLGYLF